MKKFLSLTALSLVLTLNTTKAQITELPWNSGTITSAENLQGWTFSDENATVSSTGLRLERPSGEGGFITSPELQMDNQLTISIWSTRGTIGTLQLQGSTDGINFTVLGNFPATSELLNITTGNARFIRIVQIGTPSTQAWHNITNIWITLRDNTTGTTGDLRWRFTRNDEFIIDGVGDMPDYTGATGTTGQPWNSAWNANQPTKIIIGDSVTSIGNFAFSTRTSINTIIFGERVRRIGNSAFQSCTGPTSIYIPNAVETIGDNAFAQMTNLDYVLIGEGVRHIGTRAFWGNPILNAVRFNAIDCRTFGTEVFVGGPTNQHTHVNTFLFGENVRTIPARMFAGNTSRAFRVLWQSGQIPQGATMGNLTIPPTIRYIGEEAFLNTQFRVIEIPASVDTIARGAFMGNTFLEQLRSNRATPPVLTGSLVFHNIDRGRCTLVVPQNAWSAYSTAPQWQDFMHIVDPAFFSAALQSISANGEGVDGFNSGTFTYFMVVPHEVNTITLNAEAVGSGSTISGIGTFDLNVGLNVFVIRVTAADGETMLTYTVGVHRQDKTPCGDCGNDPCTCETTAVHDLANDNSITV